jgi:limonene-1,2-epoxide hydrolase
LIKGGKDAWLLLFIVSRMNVITLLSVSQDLSDFRARHVSGRGYNVGMTDSAESVAQAFVRAINRQDVEALAGLMTEGHRFVDSLGNVTEDREKMRAGWVAYFRMVPNYTIAVEETLSDGPLVMMVGMAQGTYVPDGERLPKSQNRDLGHPNQWKTPAAFRAFIEDGKVAEWRVYADNEPIRQRMRESR